MYILIQIQQLMKNFKTGSCLFQKREMKRVRYMQFEPKNLTETVSIYDFYPENLIQYIYFYFSI